MTNERHHRAKYPWDDLRPGTYFEAVDVNPDSFRPYAYAKAKAKNMRITLTRLSAKSVLVTCTERDGVKMTPDEEREYVAIGSGNLFYALSPAARALAARMCNELSIRPRDLAEICIDYYVDQYDAGADVPTRLARGVVHRPAPPPPDPEDDFDYSVWTMEPNPDAK